MTLCKKTGKKFETSQPGGQDLKRAFLDLMMFRVKISAIEANNIEYGNIEK